MRAAFIGFSALLFFAYPIASLFMVTGRHRDRAEHKPQPAAIVLTAGTARQWLNEDEGVCIHAVLGDDPERENSSDD